MITPTEYNVIAPLIMRNGIGDGKTSACLVAQAATIDALRNGKTLEKATDDLKCACPVLRRLAIRINDASWWKSDEERTEILRPLIPLLLDSRGSKALTERRIFRAADSAVRELTPARLDFIAKHSRSDKVKSDNTKGALALRSLATITDKDTALKARDVCQEWRRSASASASAYADASAYASAYADASAYASAYADASASAYAYASASAYAYADASASAYAYADASASAYAYASASAYAYAYAQKLKYRTMAIALFRELAAMKEGK